MQLLCRNSVSRPKPNLRALPQAIDGPLSSVLTVKTIYPHEAMSPASAAFYGPFTVQWLAIAQMAHS
jgi:hypothetical protein